MNAAESLARLAVARPVAVTVMAVAVALVGYLGFTQLAVDLLPDLQSPTIAISVSSGDRPPTEMERLYGEQLEQRLFSVQGIREISQIARTGKLVATVIFDWETDLELAVIDVQKAIGPMSADPAVDEVQVQRFDPRQAAVLTYGLLSPTGEPNLTELRRLARRQIAPGLEQLPGVAEVRVTGGRDKEVEVLLDRYRMDAFGVTLGQIEQRIIDENVDLNAGTLEEDNDIFLIRGVARYRKAEDVSRVVIRYVTDQAGLRTAIRVSDVATVRETTREIDHLVRVDGIEGVGLSIYKEAGANTVDVSKEVSRAIVDLADDLPSVKLVQINDDAALVNDAISDLQIAFGVGLVLAVIVLSLFLRSLGATLVISAAIPVSLLAALFLMRFADQSLNIVTLAGLALGAGMLVDNAIVVVESIYRRLAQGDSAGDAAARGTGQVAGAITASTLTTCVVFLPVLFVEGLAARLIEGIAFTVVVSLMASLAVAVFLIPALARWFMPAHAEAETEVPRYRLRTQYFVAFLLRHATLVVLTTVLISGSGIWMLVQLGTELLPTADPRQFSVRVVGPSGQRVESTERVIAGIESIVEQATEDGIKAMMAEIGRLPEDGRMVRTEMTEENTARLAVKINADGPTGRQIADHLNEHLEVLPDTRVDWEVGSSALAGALGTGGPPILVEISGQALPDLKRGAATLQTALAELPQLWNVRSSFEGGPPELHIKLDRATADGLGVNLNTLGRVLSTSLDGRDVTMLAVGDEEWPIAIRLEQPGLEDIEEVTFRNDRGSLVAVGDVAKLSEEEGAREIFRRDQRRTAAVTAQISDGFEYPVALAAVEQRLAELELGPGLYVQLRGEEEERARTFGELQLAAILALILVLMVLAGSFESLIHPLTVLAAIPIGMIGVAIVLVPLGQPVGVMAMMGLIVLAGVAVNDAVLLIATARQLMDQGQDRTTALATAAGIRLRPIIMTTMTTVLVMLPLIFGTGEGAALRAPMAMTIIGGIIASTIGSILVMPCLYLVLDRLRPGRWCEQPVAITESAQ